jgi:site-specific DNA-cytosine methylase
MTIYSKPNGLCDLHPRHEGRGFTSQEDKQAGNSVVMPIIRRIVEQIIIALD